MTVRRRASPAAGGSGAVGPGSEAQQCLQQLNPVHSGQQDGHHVQLRQPRRRQRLKNEFLEKLQKAGFSVKPSLGSVDSTLSAYELLRLRLRISRFVLIINVV